MTVTLKVFSEFSKEYLGWLNDPEINRYTSRGVFPVTEDLAREYIKTCQSPERIVWAIYVNESKPGQYANHGHIGNVSLQKIDMFNASAELAILIGARGTHGKGFGFEAARQACVHGFHELGLNRIYCGTHQDNLGMQALSRKLGMVFEGRSRRAFFKHGRFADIIHYGLLKEEFIHADFGIDPRQPLPDHA